MSHARKVPQGGLFCPPKRAAEVWPRMKRLIRAAILPMCNERLMCRRLMSWLHSFMESAGKFPISWVDFLTLLVVLVGFVRGRKGGLAEEMLDTLQWILIIVAGAVLFLHIGGVSAP